MKMKLLNFASLAVIATWWSLSPISSAFAGEDARALSHEPQHQRNVKEHRERSPIEKFPLALLSHIGTFLKEKDLVPLLLTCNYIKECRDKALEQRDVLLKDRDLLLPDLFKKLWAIKKAKVTFDRISLVKDGFFARFSNIHHIQSLTLKFFDLTDDALESISRMHGLQSLTLTKLPKITTAGIMHVSSMRNLTILALQYLNLTDDALESISSMHDLQSLDCTNLRRVTTAGIVHVSSMHNLQSLTLKGLPLGDDALKHVSNNMHNLQRLFLGCLDFLTGAGIAHVVSMDNLQILSLDSMGFLTDAHLACISGMPGLKEVTLSSRMPQITGVGIEYVARYLKRRY